MIKFIGNLKIFAQS